MNELWHFWFVEEITAVPPHWIFNPSFTSAAYNNSFYVFYKKYSNTPRGVSVTSDLNLLSSRVINNKKELSSSVSSMVYLLKNIKWLTSQPKITLLTDADVINYH